MRDFDLDIFEHCISNAKKSEMLHRHGAIIYRNGEVIGQGFNHRADHLFHSFSLHAEVAAIKNVKKKDRQKLKDATLIVVRVGNDGNIKMSKPCENCRRFIESSGIKKVFYST
jgi:deoxycytidylate deaminase